MEMTNFILTNLGQKIANGLRKVKICRWNMFQTEAVTGGVLLSALVSTAESYSEPYQTSMMQLFAKIVKPLRF